MIIIFPLAASDRKHASAFLKLLQAFGPYNEDKALILPTPSAYYDPLLRPIVDGIQALFSPDNCKIELCPNDFGSSWPYAPSSHFKFAMEVIDQLGWHDSSLWMEPDFQPACQNWLKLIKDDYQMASTPFRGMLEKTRYIDSALQKQPDGTMKVISRTPRYDGTIHLVGAGIYPPNYIQYITPSKNGEKGSPMASYRNPGHYIPFDVKCQDQHVPATQSPLMLHKPRTVNWRRVQGTLFACEDWSVDEFGLSYAGMVDLKGVALVHGPKDDSFAKAILEGVILNPIPNDGVLHEVEKVRGGQVIGSLTEGEKALVDQLDLPMPLGSTEGSREEILSERIQDLELQNQLLQEQCQIMNKRSQELQELVLSLQHKPSVMEEEPEPTVSQAPEKRKPGRPKGSGKVKGAASA